MKILHMSQARLPTENQNLGIFILSCPIFLGKRQTCLVVPADLKKKTPFRYILHFLEGGSFPLSSSPPLLSLPEP